MVLSRRDVIEEYERALLADGEQRQIVLRNLHAAQRAMQERHASADGPG